MQTTPLPYNEAERLEALYLTGLLDSAPDPVFDAITLKAAQLTECPMALITLVDKDPQWFKSKIGLTAQTVPRDWSVCTHTILLSRGSILVVPDMRLDQRFATSPLVTDEPFLQFYAGAPIEAPGGQNIGTICCVDLNPRADFSEHQSNQLKELASKASNAVSDVIQAKALQSISPVDRKLGERLKQARVDAELSLEDISQELSISLCEIRAMESGALRIKAATLQKLSSLLGVSVRYFFQDL